ncbi:unnamed protein product, partial [Closterium sp. NIES-54]
PRDNIFNILYDPISDTIYGYSEQQQPLVLEVICNGRRLQALVDSGASHSVCDCGTLEKNGESLEETQFTATMVDGTKLPIHSKSTLQLQIGALRWKPTLPITNIKGLDFILGRDFLKRFNPEIDWVNRKTCIYNNGKRVELRSWTDTGSVPETTLARFERTVNESNTGYLALVMAAAEEEVLEQYKDIMPDDLPAGVPPARTHEHEIVEEPGAKPVSRAPYRLNASDRAVGAVLMQHHERSLQPITYLSKKLLQWEKDLAVRKGSGKIWVPNYAPLRQIQLEEFHDIPYAGHFGSNKTLAGIAKYYYWPRMAADVQQFVTSCDTCQRMKSSKQKKKQGYFSLYPYRSSHGRSLASTSSQDFLRPHGGTIPSSW